MRDLLEAVSIEDAGRRAYELLKEITQYHRIQVSPGYEEAIYFLKGYMEEYGITAFVEDFEAGRSYWGYKTPTGWAAKSAELYLVYPDGRKEKLADFEENPISLIQRSASTGGDWLTADLVVLRGNGEKREDYAGLDVRSKFVLSNGKVWRVRDLAVEELGAYGIIHYGFLRFGGMDSRKLKNTREYVAYWDSEDGEKPAYGFSITLEQAEKLRSLGKKARLVFRIDTHSPSLDILNLAGEIKGETDEEILLIAHLCHPKPGANDNASGVVVLVESVRILKSLIDSGFLPPPRRTISFLLVPEYTGTFAFLSRHFRKRKIVAGINLDMIGEDQAKTGSSFKVIDLPYQLGGLEGALLFDILRKYAAMENLKISFSEFTVGSDHEVFSDPTVGVHMPHLNQWPDLYYHTDQDAPDKVSSVSLGVGILTSVSFVYTLANAGLETFRRACRVFADLLPERVRAHLNKLEEADIKPDRKSLYNYFLDFASRSYRNSTKIFTVDFRKEHYRDFMNQVVASLEKSLRDYKPGSSAGYPELGPEIPRRRKKGTHFLKQRRHELSPDDREALSLLLLDRKNIDMTNSLFMWMDGKKDLNQIGEKLIAEGHYNHDYVLKLIDIALKLDEIELR